MPRERFENDGERYDSTLSSSELIPSRVDPFQAKTSWLLWYWSKIMFGLSGFWLLTYKRPFCGCTDFGVLSLEIVHVPDTYYVPDTDGADSCKETAKAGHHIIRSGSSQHARQGQIIYHESYSDHHERKTEKHH